MNDPTYLPPNKVIDFADTIDMVGQQKASRLVPYCRADLAYSAKGDRFTAERTGFTDPVEMLTDWAPTPVKKLPKFRRIAFARGYEDGIYVPNRERAEGLIDPMNEDTRALAMGRERHRDKTILQRGIFAATQYETTPEGDIQQVAFPTTNIVGLTDQTYPRGRLDGAAALPTEVAELFTPAKVRKSKKLLADGELDPMGEVPVILYEEEDLLMLMTSAELTDADLTQLKRLENHEIDVWAGLRWVKVDPKRLPLVPGQTDQFYTAIYHPHYIQYKDRPLVNTQISQRPDMKYNWQAYYSSQDFALRKDDNAVIWMPFKRG